MRARSVTSAATACAVAALVLALIIVASLALGSRHIEPALVWDALRYGGQTQDARVVLSLPAEQAQGTEPVVVVIDVLAIEPAKSSASVAEQSGGAPTSTQSAPSSTPTPQDHS